MLKIGLLELSVLIIGLFNLKVTIIDIILHDPTLRSERADAKVLQYNHQVK